MALKDVGNKVPIYKLKTTDEVMKYYDDTISLEDTEVDEQADSSDVDIDLNSDQTTESIEQD